MLRCNSFVCVYTYNLTYKIQQSGAVSMKYILFHNAQHVLHKAYYDLRNDNLGMVF